MVEKAHDDQRFKASDGHQRRNSRRVVRANTGGRYRSEETAGGENSPEGLPKDFRAPQLQQPQLQEERSMGNEAQPTEEIRKSYETTTDDGNNSRRRRRSQQSLEHKREKQTSESRSQRPTKAATLEPHPPGRRKSLSTTFSSTDEGDTRHGDTFVGNTSEREGPTRPSPMPTPARQRKRGVAGKGHGQRGSVKFDKASGVEGGEAFPTREGGVRRKGDLSGSSSPEGGVLKERGGGSEEEEWLPGESHMRFS